MLLKGKTAELIIKLDPKLYSKYIWENKKESPMLYVKLKKALYGILQAALLFWRLLSDMLILLVENGSTSSGKRTRHLNLQYYFVTDRKEG